MLEGIELEEGVPVGKKLTVEEQGMVVRLAKVLAKISYGPIRSNASGIASGLIRLRRDPVTAENIDSVLGKYGCAGATSRDTLARAGVIVPAEAEGEYHLALPMTAAEAREAAGATEPAAAEPGPADDVRADGADAEVAASTGDVCSQDGQDAGRAEGADARRPGKAKAAAGRAGGRRGKHFREEHRQGAEAAEAGPEGPAAGKAAQEGAPGRPSSEGAVVEPPQPASASGDDAAGAAHNKGEGEPRAGKAHEGKTPAGRRGAGRKSVAARVPEVTARGGGSARAGSAKAAASSKASASAAPETASAKPSAPAPAGPLGGLRALASRFGILRPRGEGVASVPGAAAVEADRGDARAAASDGAKPASSAADAHTSWRGGTRALAKKGPAELGPAASVRQAPAKAKAAGDDAAPARQSGRGKKGRPTSRLIGSGPRTLDGVRPEPLHTPEATELRRQILDLDPRLWLNGWLLSCPEAYELYGARLRSLDQALRGAQTLGDGTLTCRELSYRVFGDEKFLEQNGDGRKLLELMGLAEIVRHRPSPHLGMLHFVPRKRSHMRLVVSENLDPWYGMRDRMYADGRSLILGEHVDGVVFGNGYLIDDARRLPELLASLECDDAEILYWGDIDRAGLQIYDRLRRVAGGRFELRPFVAAYAAMARRAAERYPNPLDNEASAQEGVPFDGLDDFCAELPEDVRGYVHAVIEGKRLIPQEIVTRVDL